MNLTALADHLLSGAEQYAERPALIHPEGELRYQDLLNQALALANSEAFIAETIEIIPGHQSLDEYIAIFACLLSGKPYLPLNPKMPSNRVAKIFESIKPLLTSLQIDKQSSSIKRMGSVKQSWLKQLAYIIFTSGSSGEPKGVPIAQVQLSRYGDILKTILKPLPSDRVLQLGDLSFDISIMAMAMAWPNGAALCTVPPQHVLMAARYAEDMDITIWLSVPSVITLSVKAGLLAPNSLPHIRLAIFGGEVLTYETAHLFSKAAPNAHLFNFWGPTEGTISLSHYEIDRAKLDSVITSSQRFSIVPIGKAHPGVELALWDATTMQFSQDIGELCVHSEQITEGYIHSKPEEAALLNENAFFMHEGKRWYRTGDSAQYDAQDGYHYLGRVDRQIKFNGYRIELAECESALRQASGSDQVCIIPDLEANTQKVMGLVGFMVPNHIQSEISNEVILNQIVGKLESMLPPYMIPGKLRFIEALPLTLHGKLDYPALLEKLKATKEYAQ